MSSLCTCPRTDSTVLQAIGPVNTILTTIYGPAYSNSKQASILSAITFAGEVFGIFLFGYTSDHWSRKWSLFISTILLFVFAALSAGAYGAHGTLDGLFSALVAYRFLIGVGIGGEYPAGSVGCAESTGELDAGKRNRWFIWFTNLQIDVGFVVAYIVATVVVYITGETHLRAAWRIILGIGVIPPLSLIWMRFKLKEPEAFQREKMSSKQKTPWLLILKFYWFRIMIVSAIWFIYDFSSFAFGLYSSDITGSLLGDDMTLWKTFGWAILINAFYLPGAMAGSFISDWLGPRMTLAIFVAAQGVVGFIMAGVYEPLSRPGNIGAFCVVYGIFLSLGEVGPGDNIGLVASKTCATPVRGQYYAIAAAFGKIGAFVGTYVFKYIQAAGGPKLNPTPAEKIRRGQYPFWVAASLCFLAAGLALFCLPHIGQDTIDEEDRRFRAYLTENGYDVSTMGAGNATLQLERDDSSSGADEKKQEYVKQS